MASNPGHCRHQCQYYLNNESQLSLISLNSHAFYHMFPTSGPKLVDAAENKPDDGQHHH